MTDAYPDLIGARLDMAALTGQLENCASPHAGAAADLNDLVRHITQGHLPDTFIDSARAVTSAGDADTRAFFLSLGIRDEHAGSGMPDLLSRVREVLPIPGQSEPLLRTHHRYGNHLRSRQHPRDVLLLRT
ncbi:hypothetical protein [Arthrobacter sp. UYCo732]|uniref:hypothetical protein n=1 Tax=Arthrobacter sp. UYCo732 TaxID=3156336 RepID=UPI00339A50E4